MRLVAKWCFGWLGMLVFAVAIYGCVRVHVKKVILGEDCGRGQKEGHLAGVSDRV